MQGAKLGTPVCPEPPCRPQNQRRSVLQQLERRAGRFALEAAGLILPAGTGLGATGTGLGATGSWQLLGLSGGSRGAPSGGNQLRGEDR